MPNEEIKYVFTGDASGLQEASQQAIDSLKRVENAESSVNTSANFENLKAQLQSLTSLYTPLAFGINEVNKRLLITAQSCAVIAQGFVTISTATQQVTRSLGQLTAEMQSIPSETVSIAGALPQVSSAYGQYEEVLRSVFLASQQNHSASVLLASGLYDVETSATALIPEVTSASTGLMSLTNTSSALIPVLQSAARSTETVNSAVASNSAVNSNASASCNDLQHNVRNLTTQTTQASAKQQVFNKTLQVSKTALSALSAPIRKVTNAVGSLITRYLNLYQVATLIKECVSASNDWVESLNLFNVSAGKYTDSMKANIDALTYFGGVAEKTLLDASGAFKLFTTEMGVAEANSAKMADNLTKLTLDMSSLYNKDFSEVATDLQSGLQGMTKSVRKYGIDVSNAALAETAAQLGITKKISQMNQAEKAQLRYIRIIQQTTLSQGDFARTILSPANMLKILVDQIRQAGAAIGNIFQPALQAILPICIKLALAIQEIAKWLATLVGYKGFDFEVDTKSMASGTSELADNLESTAKNAKEAKKQLAGFDELNNISSDTGSNSSSGSNSGAGAGISFDIPKYDSLITMTDFMPKLRTQAALITEEFKNWFEPIRTAFSQISGPLNTAVLSLKKSFAEIGKTIADFVQKDLIKNWAPGLEKVVPTVATLVQNFSSLLTAIEPIVLVLSGTFWDMYANILKIISNVIGIISKNIKAFQGPLDTLFSSLRKSLNTVFKVAGKILSDILEAVIPAVLDIATSVGPQLFDTITEIVKVVKTLWKTLWPIVSCLIDVLVPCIKILISIVSTIVGIIAPIINILLKLLNFTLQPIIAAIKVISSITKAVDKTISEVVSSIKNVVGGLFSWFDKILTKGLNSVIDFLNKVLNGVEKAINFVLKGVNKIIGWLNEIPGFNLSEMHVSIPRLSAFAKGGFPEDGLFFANHNELVGEFSNGKTAVANNDQIVSGIEAGVTRGMERALRGMNFGGDIIIDGERLFHVVRNQNSAYRRRTGSNAW